MLLFEHVCILFVTMLTICFGLATTNVKSFVNLALKYLDKNNLWTAGQLLLLFQTQHQKMYAFEYAGDRTFPVDLCICICDSLKPHDYQTALDCLTLRNGKLLKNYFIFSAE